MFTKTTYKFEKDGVIGLACGYKPEEGKILEELKILYPEKGKELVKGKERFGSILLKDDESSEDYAEEDAVEEPEE